MSFLAESKIESVYLYLLRLPNTSSEKVDWQEAKGFSNVKRYLLSILFVIVILYNLALPLGMLIYVMLLAGADLTVNTIPRIAIVILPCFILGFLGCQYVPRKEWIEVLERKVTTSLLSMAAFFLIFPFFILIVVSILALIISPIFSAMGLVGLLFFFIVGTWLGVNTNIVTRFLVSKLRSRI